MMNNEPELDDSPNDLLTKRILRLESDNSVWQAQYQLLYDDHMLILEGADALLRSVGDPLLLEEIYTIVKEKDERLAELFRPTVDMFIDFNKEVVSLTFKTQIDAAYVFDYYNRFYNFDNDAINFPDIVLTRDEMIEIVIRNKGAKGREVDYSKL